MKYVRNLRFEQKPNYRFLRGLLSDAIKVTGEQEDGIYDWMKLKKT
jgi:casein kinase 1